MKVKIIPLKVTVKEILNEDKTLKETKSKIVGYFPYVFDDNGNSICPAIVPGHDPHCNSDLFKTQKQAEQAGYDEIATEKDFIRYRNWMRTGSFD